MILLRFVWVIVSGASVLVGLFSGIATLAGVDLAERIFLGSLLIAVIALFGYHLTSFRIFDAPLLLLINEQSLDILDGEGRRARFEATSLAIPVSRHVTMLRWIFDSVGEVTDVSGSVDDEPVEVILKETAGRTSDYRVLLPFSLSWLRRYKLRKCCLFVDTYVGTPVRFHYDPPNPVLRVRIRILFPASHPPERPHVEIDNGSVIKRGPPPRVEFDGSLGKHVLEWSQWFVSPPWRYRIQWHARTSECPDAKEQ